MLALDHNGQTGVGAAMVGQKENVVSGPSATSLSDSTRCSDNALNGFRKVWRPLAQARIGSMIAL